MAKRAEAVLHQLAAKVADAEGIPAAEAFAQIADQMSLTLAKHGARATLRREARPGTQHRAPDASTPLRLASCGYSNDEEDDDETDPMLDVVSTAAA